MAAFVVDLRIALRNLVEHRRRTALLGAAVAAVTAVLVLMNSVAAGIEGMLFESSTALSTGHLNINGFHKMRSGQPTGVVADYAAVAEAAKRALPELESWMERSRGPATLVSDEGSLQVVLNGVDAAREAPLRGALQVASGRLADLESPGTLLLFEAQAAKLNVKVGDAVTISTRTLRGVANTADCRVVAIARDVGLLSEWTAFISQSTARTLYQIGQGATGVLHVYLEPSALPDIDAAARKLRAGLEQAGYRLLEPDATPYWDKLAATARSSWTGQALDVTTWRDEVSFMTWALSALRGLRTVLTAVLVAVVLSGLMNTLWISIRERTREIGALRAIGMQRSGVARLFLVEATALSFLGASAGALVGVAAALLLNAGGIRVPLAARLFLMRDTLALRVEAPAVLATVALFTLVAGVAALYPAARAARLRPVDAMSHFG